MSRVTAAVARLLLIAIGLALFVVTGEAALRVLYRDAGKRTLGGPGGASFEHDTTDGIHRGRRDVGPKTPGVPRVMVIGDSITYGLGVRDWRATWPELLAQSLERVGRPHQFFVEAVPGNDIPQHVEVMRAWIGQVQPDVLIYQWYVNDIEAISHRPDLRQPWQQWPWHSTLRSGSYLYFVLDHRLAQLMSRPHRSYVSYLRSEFVPGSLEWAEFEREFHEFAALAMQAPRRLLMLYPQVPFRDTYPLQTLHDHMHALAAPHALEIPPIAWTRAAGTLVSRADARWRQVVETTPGSGALHVQTADYLQAPGPLEVRLTVTEAPQHTEFGVVELVDLAHDAIVATAGLRAPNTGGSDDVSVRFTLPGDRVRRLAIRVRATTPAAWALANIKIPVDYGFEVIDLTQTLNTFNTHASSFDAHPNERAHEVMAEAVWAALEALR